MNGGVAVVVERELVIDLPVVIELSLVSILSLGMLGFPGVFG